MKPHHRLLSRQLKRQLGLVSAEQEAEWLLQLEAVAAREGGALALALRGLPAFLEQIDQSYAQYDRDMALSSRSLQISSGELLDANARMRTDFEAQQRALGHLREAFRTLAQRAGLADIVEDATGLEALSQRLVALIAAHDAAQRALQASEAQFRALTELSTDWYWEQDTDLRFVNTAGRSDDRGGIPAQTHLGEQRWSLPNTEPVSMSWEEHRAALLAHETFHDLLLRRSLDDGGVYYVEVSGAPVFDADGRFSGYRGIARDVTQRVEAQAALSEAKQAADAASAAKSRFLANMSHEIRTPMSGLLGMAELLLDEDLSPRQRERVLMLQASGRTLVSIINDILDFSKIEAGRVELEHIAFGLRDTVDQLVGMFAVQAHAKSLPLNLVFDAPLTTTLVGDAMRLKQVLGNLLGNAVKFTQRGSVTLRVGLQTAGAQPMLRVEVHDTGAGIDAALAATLFHPFTQADASTTRRFGGTGLGLAIAKHLTELMGGRIGLASTPGQGSTFWVDWPAELAAAPRHAVGGKADPGAGVGWRGRRALLVEDNEVNMIVGQTQLQHLGLEVTTAIHGALALDLMRSQAFDVVLMDCQMPVMDGYEAVGLWRRDEAQGRTSGSGAPRLPVIALTANAMAGDRERSLAAGFDDHLGKPFTREDLRLVLGRWLGSAD